jgi:hypothetical protein
MGNHRWGLLLFLLFYLMLHIHILFLVFKFVWNTSIQEFGGEKYLKIQLED